MPSVKSVIVSCDMVTPYGSGVASCWTGLLSGRTGIRHLSRFETEFFQTANAGIVQGLSTDGEESLVMQMLSPLLRQNASAIPSDAFLILATTGGEIQALEDYVLGLRHTALESSLDRLLSKVARMTAVDNSGIVVSSACASSSTAIAVGASMIRGGEKSCVLVVACDSVSEFVFAGFSSLSALANDVARPFDRNRTGLSLGEAAGYALLMSSARAVREQRPILGEVAGWGLTNDANHMTGPSRDGSGLAEAITKALTMANTAPEDIGSISAHGTGTVYNDAMEMKAFRNVFRAGPVPTYSIKGGTGHSLGASGLVEVIVAIHSLNEQYLPPTVNLTDVDDDAQGWVSSEPRQFNCEFTISTNSGFGGVNCALVLRKGDSPISGSGLP